MRQLVVSLVGLVVAEFLTRRHSRPEFNTPFCYQDWCDQVMASNFSVISGVPLSLLGCLYYLAVALLVVALLGRPRRGVAATFVILTTLGALVSLVLVGVQAFVIGAFCSLCCVSAVCCLMLRALGPPRSPGRPALALALTVLVGVGSPLFFRFVERPKVLAHPDYTLGHSLGDAAAPSKVMVFSDFECPHCRKVFGRLVELDPQRVLLCYRPFPLAYHKHGLSAALAAEAAGEQGQYWEYARRLYSGSLDEAALVRGAQELGLDMARFERDRHSTRLLERIQADVLAARADGISRVPAVFLNGVQVAPEQVR